MATVQRHMHVKKEPRQCLLLSAICPTDRACENVDIERRGVALHGRKLMVYTKGQCRKASEVWTDDLHWDLTRSKDSNTCLVSRRLLIYRPRYPRKAPTTYRIIHQTYGQMISADGVKGCDSRLTM